MIENQPTQIYQSIDTIFNDLNNKYKNLLLIYYDNISYTRNNNKIKEYAKSNKSYTFLSIDIKNSISFGNNNFDFNFFEKDKNIIVKIFFEYNNINSLNLFVKYLQNNNFINFIDSSIEKYIQFISLLPKNIYMDSKINRAKVNELSKKQNKSIKLVNSIEYIYQFKKSNYLFILIDNYYSFNQLEREIKFLRKKMKKVWSIATAVRTPERLRNFLITLKELENQEWNKETQIKFQINLIKNRLYGYGNRQFENTLSTIQIDLLNNLEHNLTFEEATDIFYTKHYQDPAMRGRTSFKPLEKMGFAFIIEKKIIISPLGYSLINANYTIEELETIFFKSFLKWQYPNPVDRDFRDNEIYNLKPFILTLHLINEVNNICKERNIKVKGISRVEFEIFGQTLLNYIDLKTQANSLVDFRLALEKVKGHKEKKDFKENYIDKFLSDFSNIDYNNLRDYADNTIRYFRLTRFIYIRGGGYYIDLEPRRMIEINNLLNTYNGSSETFTKEEYIKYISNINLPILPWEEKDKLIEIYTNLINDITNLQEQLNQEIITFKTLDNVDSLKSEIKTLRQYRHKLQNLILKQDLTDISKIDEVIESLVNIRKLDLKPSIALEKYITMALTIINDAKDIKANSLVGDDNEFIFTAPANKPDIECYYDNFNSICEVTMLNGRDQWHHEGQPVMRHFRDFEKDSSLKDNYCLFVAPQLHRDTINTFWISVKYEYEGTKQKIVPFTITQIIEILQVIKELKENDKSFSHLQFQKLLDNIINLKNNVTNSDDWLRAIPNTILNFKKEVLCN